MAINKEDIKKKIKEDIKKKKDHIKQSWHLLKRHSKDLQKIFGNPGKLDDYRWQGVTVLVDGLNVKISVENLYGKHFGEHYLRDYFVEEITNKPELNLKVSGEESFSVVVPEHFYDFNVIPEEIHQRVLEALSTEKKSMPDIWGEEYQPPKKKEEKERITDPFEHKALGVER